MFELQRGMRQAGRYYTYVIDQDTDSASGKSVLLFVCARAYYITR